MSAEVVDKVAQAILSTDYVEPVSLGDLEVETAHPYRTYARAAIRAIGQALADAQRRITELEQELERERAKHR